MFWTGSRKQGGLNLGTSLQELANQLIGTTRANQMFLRNCRVQYHIVNNNNQTLRVQMCVLQCRRDIMNRPLANCDPFWMMINNPIQTSYSGPIALQSDYNWRMQAPEFKLYWKPVKYATKIMEPGTQWDITIQKKAGIKLLNALVNPEATTGSTDTQFSVLRGLTFAVMFRWIGVPTSHTDLVPNRYTGYPPADLIGTWEYQSHGTWLQDIAIGYFQQNNTFDPQTDPTIGLGASTVVRTSGNITGLASAN